VANEQEKGAVIVESNTVIEPWAMMVSLHMMNGNNMSM
jgi:hypothetical protein